MTLDDTTTCDVYLVIEISSKPGHEFVKRDAVELSDFHRGLSIS